MAKGPNGQMVKWSNGQMVKFLRQFGGDADGLCGASLFEAVFLVVGVLE